MRRTLIGLCIASGTFGFAMACKPQTTTQEQPLQVVRTIKADGTEVISPVESIANTSYLPQKAACVDKPSCIAAGEPIPIDASTKKLIDEVFDEIAAGNYNDFTKQDELEKRDICFVNNDVLTCNGSHAVDYHYHG